MKYIQRFVLTLSVLVAGFFGSAALAQGSAAGGDPRLQDVVLGNANAPITIIEYASLTCPHCARFHAETLPALKTEYIDTGKVKLIYRDFPLDQLAFAGSVLARCGGPDKYYTFLNVLFSQQRQWASSNDPKAALVQIGRLGGVSAEQFEACLADKPLNDYILNTRLEGNQKFNVTSTPTLIVDGKMVPGAASIEEMRKLLADTGKLDKVAATSAAAVSGAAAAPAAAAGIDTTVLIAAAAVLLAVLLGGVWYFKRRRG